MSLRPILYPAWTGGYVRVSTAQFSSVSRVSRASSSTRSRLHCTLSGSTVCVTSTWWVWSALRCCHGLMDLTIIDWWVSSLNWLFFVLLWLLQESIKPVLKCEGSDSEEQRVRERQVAMSVLYHSVSVSLALLSPFMPFITEEMWQRLVPYGDSDRTSASLCVQPYPKTSQLVSQSETPTLHLLRDWEHAVLFLTQNNSFQSPTSPQEHWYFPKEEADFSLVQEVVRVTRLLRAQCQMTKERPDCEKISVFFLLHANVLDLVAVFAMASISQGYYC